MHRIDDDARQPRRIEHALFEVELPGAVLLRHQAALQAVGETGDHALQIRQLLVEIAAQTIELFRLAQILGLDLLVEFIDEGAVFRTAMLVVTAARTPGLRRGLGIAHIGVVGHVRTRRIRRLGAGFLRILGGGFRLLHRHALHIFGFRRVALFAVFVLAAIVVALL